MTQPSRRRWYALVLLCFTQLMIVLDGTIVTVALPTIQDDLDFSQTGLSWVVNAYLIGFGGFLLLAGRFADLFGRRRLFMAGIAIFTLASAACGAAQEPWMLVAARGIQGVGGAVMAAVAFAIVIATFTDGAERARALGVWGFTASGGGSIGVLLGGVLTASLSWHWIFLVNVPIGIAVFVLAPRLLDADPVAEQRPSVDVPGAITIVSGLAIGVYAIVGAVDRGWTDPVTVALLALAVALVVAFIVIEGRTAEPLVPFDLFHSRSFTVANALSVLVVAGMFGWFFFGALYLQEVLGFSTLQTGLAFLPATLALGLLSIGLSARIAMTIGPRRALVIGLLLGGAGVLLLARASADGSYIVDVLPSQLLIGVGIGMAFMPIFMILTSDVAPELSGLASGVMQTVQQFGGALGLAVLTAIAASRSDSSGAPSGSPEALLAGYHGAFLVGAISLLLAALGAAVLLPASKGAPVAHEAQETHV
jgi:EmrB/QacA subfamily drug resistance transporter